MNYRLLIQYDGTRYEGWQRQTRTDQTIQGKIEAILSKMLGRPVEIQGAGRTDAGVHARGQVANVKMRDREAVAPEILRAYLNRYLPEDIAVVNVTEVDERFHSRLNAKRKIYRYRIGTGEVHNVFERKYLYDLRDDMQRRNLAFDKLNITEMRRAAELLTGEHDFQSFCSNKKMKKSTVRTINNISFEELSGELRIIFDGNGFLYNMVRILTGTLIEVGLGERSADEMTEILTQKCREKAGFTAPAKGLTLLEVRY